MLADIHDILCLSLLQWLVEDEGLDFQSAPELGKESVGVHSITFIGRVPGGLEVLLCRSEQSLGLCFILLLRCNHDVSDASRGKVNLPSVDLNGFSQALHVLVRILQPKMLLVPCVNEDVSFRISRVFHSHPLSYGQVVKVELLLPRLLKSGGVDVFEDCSHLLGPSVM